MEKLSPLKFCQIQAVYRLKSEPVTSRICIKVAIRSTQKLDCWTQHERRAVDCLQCRIF